MRGVEMRGTNISLAHAPFVPAPLQELIATIILASAMDCHWHRDARWRDWLSLSHRLPDAGYSSVRPNASDAQPS